MQYDSLTWGMDAADSFSLFGRVQLTWKYPRFDWKEVARNNGKVPGV